jgi:3-hydroxymyristoyl/3-hydroxydecanoyl-(acyl carrier protein) dehydratase
MTGALRVFSFVDRIVQFEPGVGARGRFTIPDGFSSLWPSLMVEALAQLAAWLGMAHTGFRRRPVAALAGEVQFGAYVVPRQIVELAVEIDECNTDVVAYDGCARVDGVPIVEARHCVGAMLPMEDFDDPKAVRERFEVLCGPGLPPQTGWDDALPLQCDVIACDGEARRHATVRVPEVAAFFAEHFPRKPVLPAAALADAQIRLAIGLLAEARDADWRLLRPRRVLGVKARSFVLPGQLVDLYAEVVGATADVAEVALTARVGGKRVSTGRVEIGDWDVS